MTRVHVDIFTSLDDVPRRDEGDPLKVLQALSNLRRYSCFDATRSYRMAKTMTALHHDHKWIRSVGDAAYPWTEFELTEAGRKALESA